jgi:serine/threonine protein kinase
VKKNFETFGNYILLEKLAAGGMAEVYLAKKVGASGVQKFVAIKRILQQFSDSKDFIAMFKDEAKIAINLSHSNVVSIYDFGVEDEQFYIVMEFVEGRNLRQILNRMKRVDQYFSVSQVAHIIKQVAAGLDHAHRCIDPTTGKPLNIIHRDMSPQNVMLGFEGEPKVVDFGIAKAAHQIEATRAGTLKGKFGYMSPEQVEGHSVDSRTDIFALGIMTWEMLANQRLFLANSEINTLRKIRECDVPSLRKINPNIPAELDQIVQKSLKKEKLERYQTAGDMHRDLQGFLSRFDPDFSVQDLSSFVKKLFSDEIVQIRKKQIMYAQATAGVTLEGKSIAQTNSAIDRQSMSLDHISFSHVSNQAKQAADGTLPTSTSTYVSEEDFSDAQIDDGKTKARQLHAAKRKAHEKVQAYKKQTYTDTEKTLRNLENKNKNGLLLTVIFSLTFLMMFFAYLNKFHPNFKRNFCKSMESYGVCPRSVYLPSNLLQLSTSPRGAEIYINDQRVGVSPFELRVKQLPIKIAVRKEGYASKSETLNAIPESNRLSFDLARVPTGFLIVKSVGVNIFIDETPVKSGQKVSVPAGRDVNVKVRNPFSGQTYEEVHRLKENQTKSIYIDPPTSNGI